MWDAIEAAGTKPFGFMKFTPGPGVGGHCLPIDPSYLSWKVKQTLGHAFRFVDLANDINEHMPDHVVGRLTLALNNASKSLRGSRLLLIGLAYKKNSSDARESPAIRVAQLLGELGASLDVVDGHISSVPRGLPTVNLVDSKAAAFGDYDAVVVLTDHDDVDYGRIRSEARYVLDTRHRLEPANNVEFL